MEEGAKPPVSRLPPHQPSTHPAEGEGVDVTLRHPPARAESKDGLTSGEAWLRPAREKTNPVPTCILQECSLKEGALVVQTRGDHSLQGNPSMAEGCLPLPLGVDGWCGGRRGAQPLAFLHDTLFPPSLREGGHPHGDRWRMGEKQLPHRVRRSHPYRADGG